MKYVKITALLLLSSVLFFYGCNDTSKTSKQDTAKPVKASETTSPVNPSPVEPAQNASGVWHYTCRLGCAGGAGSAAKCETCGNTLAHNTTYHAKANTNTSPFATSATPSATPATPREPAQNAAGVWHYTCIKGHAGGSGSAVACSTCNTTLSHNKAYH